MKRRTDPADVHLVDTDSFSRDRSRVAGRVPVAALQRLASQLASTAGDIEYEFEGELDERRRPAATLRARGSLTQRCDLCEREVTLPLGIDGRYWFAPDEAALDALPLEGDDEREPLVGGHRFDVAQLVEDEAILALPISPRHAACEAALESRGEQRAPQMGTPEESAPDRTDRPNPFAVLASLKGRGNR